MFFWRKAPACKVWSENGGPVQGIILEHGEIKESLFKKKRPMTDQEEKEYLEEEIENFKKMLR